MPFINPFQKYIDKIPKRLQNRYVLAIVLFFIFFLVFSKYNIYNIYKLNREVKRLEKEKRFYRSHIDKIRREKANFDHNLEKFAREKYFVKRPGEEVFVIETH